MMEQQSKTQRKRLEAEVVAVIESTHHSWISCQPTMCQPFPSVLRQESQVQTLEVRGVAHVESWSAGQTLLQPAVQAGTADLDVTLNVREALPASYRPKACALLFAFPGQGRFGLAADVAASVRACSSELAGCGHFFVILLGEGGGSPVLLVGYPGVGRYCLCFATSSSESGHPTSPREDNNEHHGQLQKSTP